MPRNFPRKCLSLYSVGQKKSHKIPAKFPTKFPKFPCEKSKNIHRRASAGAQVLQSFLVDAGLLGQHPLLTNVAPPLELYTAQALVGMRAASASGGGTGGGGIGYGPYSFEVQDCKLIGH